MTTLRNVLFGILPRATTFQVISITQWLTSKKCLNSEGMHSSLDSFLDINQSIKECQDTANNLLQGHSNNNYYEVYRPHN